MAKGQHLSNHQQGIVKRYYENRDTINLTKLQELVSDLYLAPSPGAADKLWKRIEKALPGAGANPARAQQVLSTRSVTDLAALVGELAGRK